MCLPRPGRRLRRLRRDPRPGRRGAGRHRHAERRFGAALRHRAAGGHDQLQHRASPGSGSDVDKVRGDRARRERRPDLAVDGPLQYDAAAITIGRAQQAPGSPVAGQATVFIFPDLNTGNTTYKAVQRSADVVSIGPMLQGLAAGERSSRGRRWSRTSSTRSRSPPSRPESIGSPGDRAPAGRRGVPRHGAESEQRGRRGEPGEQHEHIGVAAQQFGQCGAGPRAPGRWRPCRARTGCRRGGRSGLGPSGR